MELQSVGSLEVGSLNNQSLKCWDLIPHMLLFPGAQQVFQTLNPHPLPRANSPRNQGAVFALALWLVGSAQH